MKKYQIIEVLYKKYLLKKGITTIEKLDYFLFAIFLMIVFCTLYFITISNFFTAHQNMVLYSV
ncbi:Hypothetical protein GbCGDNIH2_0180 [Granulibacter bethesdensis]|nr:Hypothetical protein GbCGDNIH2_0180 [Granulibacter bethesdensis]